MLTGEKACTIMGMGDTVRVKNSCAAAEIVALPDQMAHIDAPVRAYGHEPIGADDRARIIAAALPLLSQGVPTDQIAAPYGITGRTLRIWLMLTPEADNIRAEYLSGKVMDAARAVDAAQDAFPLARARESFRAWSWLAERRLPKIFAPSPTVSIGLSIDLGAALAAAERRMSERVIEAVTPAQSADTL